MIWNVFRHDCNRKIIEVFNVFEHRSFKEDVDKLLQKDISYVKFQKELNSIARYYFWSKCEYEIIITSFPTYINLDECERLDKKMKVSYQNYYSVDLDVEKKVDIYQQLQLNWDMFTEYVWRYRLIGINLV